MENHNIKIEINAEISCPKCGNGNLLPFVRARYKNESSYAEKEFDHYEVFYRCSNCNYMVESDSFF